MNGRRGMILAVTASLIVGCAMGLIGGVLFARSVMFYPRGPWGHRGPGGPGEHHRMLRYVEENLGLSMDQRDRIEKIVAESRSQADSLRAHAREQILQVLTPEQREKWERMDQRFFPRRGGPPPGGPGGGPPPGDPGNGPPPDRP